MPAYTQHQETELRDVFCPHCIGLPMYVVDVKPHWSVATLDFTYECSACGFTSTKIVENPKHARHRPLSPTPTT
jgi:hypothetical protein